MYTKQPVMYKIYIVALLLKEHFESKTLYSVKQISKE